MPLRIFVGYGYHARDAWIADLVFKLVEDAFGDEFVSGKEIFGQALDTGVRGLIETCYAVIGFTTRREEIQGTDTYTTHQWVKDELLTAKQHDPPIHFVEVRETKVDSQQGLLGNHARIEYDEAKRDRCLIDLATTLGGWHRLPRYYEIELMPRDISQEVRLHLTKRDFQCVYQVLRDGEFEPDEEVKVKLISFKNGLIVRTKPLPEDASIKVAIYKREKLLWNSDFQPVHSRLIHLERK